MSLRVRDILHYGNVITVKSTATVDDLNRILADQHISGAPVVDETGKLVGVISLSDIARLISKNLVPPPGFYNAPISRSEQDAKLAREIRERTIGEVMERRVHSVELDDPISTVAKMMRNLHIHRVLVVEAGEVAGILSALDLLQVIERPHEFAEFYRERTV